MRPVRGVLIVLSLAALLALPCCTVERPRSEGAAGARYPIEDFLATTGMLRNFSFSPDGTSILVSSDESGVFNAVTVPVGGGRPQPLTRSKDDAVEVQTYFPHDLRFLYLSDRGGNELSHLYVR